MRKIRGASFGALLLIAGCTGGPTTPTAASPTPTAASPTPTAASPTPCQSPVTRDALPDWARGGFTDDGSGTPHVISEHGDLIAVLFDYPPTAGADPEAGNKILWKSRLPQEPMQPLQIEATLAGTTTPVRRQVREGAGPSYVQLPQPGCWRLLLIWSGHQDRMTLQFH